MNPQQLQQLVTTHVRYAGEWKPYIGSAPPSDALVRFWNEYNGQEWTGTRSEMHPAFNVACLWWKLTGIERMRCTTITNDLR